MKNELAVIIPTYNEHDNIVPLVAALEKNLKQIHWEVIFVDDDSPDGTTQLIRKLALDNPRVRCIQRIGRRGLSSACIEGILASSSPYLAVMDADLQHDEGILPEMLATLKQGKADLVIGSRYLQGGSTGGLSPLRVRASRIATRLSRLITGTEVSDPMSGFFMLSRPFFESVLRRLSGKGFKILLDILVSSGRSTRIREIPYTMRQRSSGASKLSAHVIWDFFTLVAHRALGRFLPLRFISFITVGFSGVLVHLVVLGLLHNLTGSGFMWSQSLATLVAMVSNFILNNMFTYRDARLHGLAFYRGLLSFCLACSLGAVINVALATRLFDLSFTWWLAGMCGAIAGAVWNYAVTSIVTWDRVES